MRKIFRSACPNDCPDTCSLLVQVEGGRVTGIKGDPLFPGTGGFTCAKGRRHIERLYSRERVTMPLVMTPGGWKEINWEDAYSLLAEKLLSIRERYGPTAVLYHDYGGSTGFLKVLSQRFFNAYGGCTLPEGSICWGSGYAAQEYDFGALYLNDMEDVLNSRTIILWGRDPVTTNIHLVPYLKKARQGGSRVISVNPLKIDSLRFCDLHLAPRPGTDGAMALAMAHVILEDGLHDGEFINANVHGFEKYRELVKEYPPARAQEITGVNAELIVQFARIYASEKPSSIIMGYGLQRYANGGGTVRAIDALAAITGNIGVPGGGVSYANQRWKGYFSDLTGSKWPVTIRKMPWPKLSGSIMDACDPPVKCIVVTRSNPVTQLPDTNTVVEAFRKTDFVVVIDQFLTDTAEMAHLFLPAATFLEKDDFIVNPWSNYLFYAPKVVDPVGQAKPDAVIFSELAEVMGLEKFGSFTPVQWMEKALEPLAPYGITLERLKEGPVRNHLAPPVAWADRIFPTPTGKYELYSERAAAEGLDPLPTYREPRESPVSTPEIAKEYPLQLLTCHHKKHIHSQDWNIRSGVPVEVEINPATAAARGIEQGSRVMVKSPRGQIEAVVRITGRVPPGVVQIYQGSWIKYGGGVNVLTPGYMPDLGMGTPYYDCLCQVERKE